jgi:hypothetical protein
MEHQARVNNPAVIQEVRPTLSPYSWRPARQAGQRKADWELRLGPDNRFRVFYQIDAEGREVHILAVGVKDRERLYFGGEEFEE